MSRDTMAEVVAASERLIRAIERAAVAQAFGNEGDGPYLALVDQFGFDAGRPGPIRKAAAELSRALLDHDAAMRARSDR